MFNIYVAVLGPVGTNCYIIINEETKESAIIDAAASADRLIRAATKDGTDLKCLLLTHAHWDHIGAVNDIAAQLPSLPIYIGENEVDLIESPMMNLSSWLTDVADSVSRDKVNTLKDGDEMTVLGETMKIIEVAGHTAGGLCYYFPESGILFCGDTLFQGGLGRSDFPTGDAELLVEQIKTKLFTLPPETKVYPGHGFATTIGEEEESNPYLQ